MGSVIAAVEARTEAHHSAVVGADSIVQTASITQKVLNRQTILIAPTVPLKKGWAGANVGVALLGADPLAEALTVAAALHSGGEEEAPIFGAV